MNNKSSHWLPRLFLWGILSLLFLPAGWMQNSPDSLKNRLEESYGKDKLVILNDLVASYLSAQNPKEALRYARQASTLAQNIISPDNQLISETDYPLKPLAFLQLGKVHQQLGQYLKSKNAFEEVLVDARRFNTPELAEEARKHLQEINVILVQRGKRKKGVLGKAFKDIASSIEKTSDDFGVKATLKLARMYENNQNYEKAIQKYTLAMNQLRDLGDSEQIEELRNHIAELENLQKNAAETDVALIEAKPEAGTSKAGGTSIQQDIDAFSERLSKVGESVQETLIPQEQEIILAEEELRDIRIIAERAETTQDYEKSLNYYKRYLAMEQTLAEQKRLQELALLEQAHQIDNQEREITLLKQNEEINQLQLTQNQTELQRQLTFKRSLLAGLFLSALLLISVYFLYRNKKRDHRKLSVAYGDLEVAQGQLKAAEQRIKGLLNQQVSGAVANELLSAEANQQVQRKFVCIMFLDIRDFTPYVEKLAPEEIIQYQNDVLGFMIETVNKHGGIVNQILGDGFMATFGAPVSTGDDCKEAYLAAQEIMQNVRAKSESGEIPATRVGIGLHAGSVVAGNVGTKNRKQYSITGNPVIIAARLEQLNKDFGSTMVISKEVYDHLPEDLQEPMDFKEVKVKGRSKPVEIASF